MYFVWLTISIDCLLIVLAFENNMNTYLTIPTLIPICRHWLSKKYNFEVKVNHFTNNTFIIKLEKFQRKIQAWRNIFCTKILMDEQATSMNSKNIITKKPYQTITIFSPTISNKVINSKIIKYLKHHKLSRVTSINKQEVPVNSKITVSKRNEETKIVVSTKSNEITNTEVTEYQKYNEFSTLTSIDNNLSKKNYETNILSSTTSNEVNRLKETGYLTYNKFSTLNSIDKHYPPVYSKKSNSKNNGINVFLSSTDKEITHSKITPYLTYFINHLTVPKKNRKNPETRNTQIWYNTSLKKNIYNTKQNLKHWLVTNPLTSTLKYKQNNYLTQYYNIHDDCNKNTVQKCITMEKQLKTDEFWHVTTAEI